ncbi:universal stress protein [Mesonia sp. HuA40]|uniref:universal stress protein n=1 Tax=Mesonia sp. HuA40 TaxID=2602761 RepID=UPI0011C8BC68|nr:universal stress protein [Mesonia sp. HuA40]TXK73569.1 universal stress protein [Mesonia sp. HuA40]
MQSILLLTDFSDNAYNALKYAVSLLGKSNCKFHLLTIDKPSSYITGELLAANPEDSIYRRVITENKTKLNNLAEKLQKEINGFNGNFQCHVLFDGFISAIETCIDKYKIDTVVLGTNGASNLEETLFGSNALKVIRQVKVTSLIIPQHFEYKKMNSILFSEHQNDDLSKKDLNDLAFIFREFQPQLHVLEINQNNSNTKHNALEKTSLQFVDYKIHRLSGIPAPYAIQAFCQLFKVDLHALFVKEESFIDRFIQKSTTTEISYQTTVPLLILR